MSTLEAIAATLIGAALIGTLVWFVLPFRNKLDRVRMTVTNDHGS